MNGDLSRVTFDPLNHYTRVVMQQGRVQLDADFNEQTAILLHYLQTLAADIIGPYGGPEREVGFETITPDDNAITNLSFLDAKEKSALSQPEAFRCCLTLACAFPWSSSFYCKCCPVRMVGICRRSALDEICARVNNASPDWHKAVFCSCVHCSACFVGCSLSYAKRAEPQR